MFYDWTGWDTIKPRDAGDYVIVVALNIVVVIMVCAIVAGVSAAVDLVKTFFLK